MLEELVNPFQIQTNADQKKTNFSLSLDLLYEKDVVCLSADNTVLEAAELMRENHIGDVIVTQDLDGRGAPIGIVTDRDIVLHVVAKNLNPESIKLSEIMTKKIVTANENHDLSDLVKLITEEGVGRLPIVDKEGNLKGILSSKRLFQYFTQCLWDLSTFSGQQQRREGKAH